jgi:hypothetical protein
VPEPIAEWNPETKVWEQSQRTLDGLSVSFSATWPTSGMTRGGRLYELPTPALRMDARGCSSLLPTPTVSDSNGPGAHGRGGADLRTSVSLLPTPTRADGDRTTAAYGNGNPTLQGALLPTPRATDGTKGGPNQRGSSGDLMLPSAVTHLLPTPTCGDAKAARNSTANRRRIPPTGVHAGDTLTDIATLLTAPSLETGEPLTDAIMAPPSDAGTT